MSGRPRTTSFAEGNKQPLNPPLGGMKISSKCNFSVSKSFRDGLLKSHDYSMVQGDMTFSRGRAQPRLCSRLTTFPIFNMAALVFSIRPAVDNTARQLDHLNLFLLSFI